MRPEGFLPGELKDLAAQLLTPKPPVPYIRIIDADLRDMIENPREYRLIQQTLRAEGEFQGFRIHGYIHPMFRGTFVLSPDEHRTRNALHIHRSSRNNIPYKTYDEDVKEVTVIGTLHAHRPHDYFWVHQYQK